MITGPDLHRLRHNLQVAADEAQMKSGAKREVLLVSLQEAKDILDALSELADRRSEPTPSQGPLDREALVSIRNLAFDAVDNQALVAASINSLLVHVTTLLLEEEE